MAGKKDKVKDSERFSILVDRLDRCWVCGTNNGIMLHEVFGGTSNRSKSKEDGMILPLCGDHHNLSSNGIHFNKQLDLYAKKEAEKIWLEKNNATIDDFIKRFGKNYLD